MLNDSSGSLVAPDSRTRIDPETSGFRPSPDWNYFGGFDSGKAPMLKELDNRYEGGPKTESGQEAYRLRQQRHQEIGKEIKALAEQKKNGPEQPE